MTVHQFHLTQTTSQVMGRVVIALLPGLLAMAWINPWWLVQPLVCGISAMICEGGWQHLRSKNVRRWSQLTDCSALVTGMLLGICLPPESPIWLGLLGGIFAITIGKQIYGGLGANPFNPAMVAYCLLLVGFPQAMTNWSGIMPDTTTAATLLDRSQTLEPDQWLGHPLYTQQIILAAGFLLGGLWLWTQRIITLVLPGSVLLGFFMADWLLRWLELESLTTSVVITGLHLPLGAVIFGAFFIATDPVTAPTQRKAQILYGIAIGLLTALIRQGDQYPDGFAFAILLANILRPSIAAVSRRQ